MIEPGGQYSISNWLNYNNLSPIQRRYALALSTIYEPKSFAEASQHPDWCKAMNIGQQALVSNNTWKVCELPAYKKLVGCNWVLKVKLNLDGTEERKKARLVARGFTQQVGLDYKKTFSPIAKLVTVKTLIAIAACKQWHIHQLDIDNAFVHGELDEEVYMVLPPSYEQQGKNGDCLQTKQVHLWT